MWVEGAPPRARAGGGRAAGGRGSAPRRVAYLESADQGGFDDEDFLWAESLDVNIKKLDDDERQKMLKELNKTFEADIADTEAYIEDAIERMRAVWDLFKEMGPKQIEHDETIFRELKEDRKSVV